MIFDLTDENDDETLALLTALSAEGHYQISKKMMSKLQGFIADWASEEEISQEINETFENETMFLTPTQRLQTMSIIKFNQKKKQLLSALPALISSLKLF